jgi:hypothetical protein
LVFSFFSCAITGAPGGFSCEHHNYFWADRIISAAYARCYETRDKEYGIDCFNILVQRYSRLRANRRAYFRAARQGVMIGRVAPVSLSSIIDSEVVEVSLTTINSFDDQELIKIIDI